MFGMPEINFSKLKRNKKNAHTKSGSFVQGKRN